MAPWATVMSQAKSKAQFSLCWAVRTGKEKRVFPVGMALILGKQVILTPGGAMAWQ